VGSAAPLDDWQRHPYCYLTTIGRVTERPHTIEIWFVVESGHIWLLTEPDGAADWVRNLRREPRVTVRVGELAVPALAEIADLPSDAAVRCTMAQRYRHADGDLDAWTQAALVVRVTLQGPEASRQDVGHLVGGA